MNIQSISFCVLLRKEGKNMRLNKQWLKFSFWVNYPFNMLLWVFSSERKRNRERESSVNNTSSENVNVSSQKCNTNAVSKSHLTCDSMQLYADKWTSRSDLVTDGFVLPSVALISFHGANEMWVRGLNIIYHNSVVNRDLTQILICLMATSKCIQLVAMNGGADSAAHTLGCLSDSLSQWLSQNFLLALFMSGFESDIGLLFWNYLKYIHTVMPLFQAVV